MVTTSPDSAAVTEDGHGIVATVRSGLALWTLFVGLAMLMVGNGPNAAVLGVRTVDEGFGVRTSGLVMASFFAGFVAIRLAARPLRESRARLRSPSTSVPAHPDGEGDQVSVER